MPLQRGEVQGYDFNRMVLEFTMLNQDKIIRCAISTAAMDDIEGRRDVKSDQRALSRLNLSAICREMLPATKKAARPSNHSKYLTGRAGYA